MRDAAAAAASGAGDGATTTVGASADCAGAERSRSPAGAGALAGAGAGAATGGLVGALIGWGIPEEDAKYYEGEVKAGKYLVTVEGGNRASDARTVLTRSGGYERSSSNRSV